MYIHMFYPSVGCNLKSPFVPRYIPNIKKTEGKCFLWCLIASLHPAEDNSNRVSNYNKPEHINEIKLSSSSNSFNGQQSFLGEKIKAPYDYFNIKKI